MKIIKEEAIDIVTGCHPDWTVVEDNITSQSRWETYYEAIVKHNPTNKYYTVDYSRGSTEQQDNQWFYGNEVEFYEVKQQEKTVLVWVPVNNEQ